MTTRTEEIERRARVIAETIADDSPTLADLSVVVREAVELAELVEDANGAEKRAVAIGLIERVIDLVDLPWIPDPLVDPLLKQLVPAFVDHLVDASKGKVEVNRDA